MVKAMMTRYMIHCVGDMHQPLHAAEMFNDQYRYGDYGGNSININYAGFPSELHLFWDCI